MPTLRFYVKTHFNYVKTLRYMTVKYSPKAEAECFEFQRPGFDSQYQENYQKQSPTKNWE